MNTVADLLIDALGGTGKVAEMMDAAASSVAGWRTKITPSRLNHLKLLAEKHGIAVPDHSGADTAAQHGGETGNESELSAQAEAA